MQAGLRRGRFPDRFNGVPEMQTAPISKRGVPFLDRGDFVSTAEHYHRNAVFPVGAPGFEPGTSWSRTKRASRAALRPDCTTYCILPSTSAVSEENT